MQDKLILTSFRIARDGKAKLKRAAKRLKIGEGEFIRRAIEEKIKKSVT